MLHKEQSQGKRCWILADAVFHARTTAAALAVPRRLFHSPICVSGRRIGTIAPAQCYNVGHMAYHEFRVP